MKKTDTMIGRSGRLFVVSGPSGVGKGTICRALTEKFPEIALSVSVTTREPRKGEAEGVISFIEHALVMLDNAESETDIAALRAELEEAGFITKKESKADRVKKVKKPHTLNVHRYNLGSGKELLIGRSNSANDELTMKYASNSDMWLHTNTIPGSHCIIRCAGAEPTEADIKEAAEAAAYYSKARNSSKVAVDYCKVKNVRKPAGARPGMVIYDNYKTAIVEPGIASLTRIKL